MDLNFFSSSDFQTPRRKNTITNIEKKNSTVNQIVTYPYPEFPVLGIFHFFGGIGIGNGTNWYRGKVSGPETVKFYT